MQIVGAVLFVVALIHTFSTKLFESLAHTQPRHAGLWHLLGEVEVVFGFWAMVMVVFMFVQEGKASTVEYLSSRNYTEPMFVFAIMVIAGTRPILQFATTCVTGIANLLPLPFATSRFWVVMAIVPLMGSFITEPAAMTLAALILRDAVFTKTRSNRLKYATLGVLFVNISIGGTLTTFAAPPILMVASTWQWDMSYVVTHLGWKAAVAVFINATAVAWLYRHELASIKTDTPSQTYRDVPFAVMWIHVAFLAGIVVFAHHPPVFMGLFLFFLGFVTAYQRHQSPLILREALMVAFFLAGLVVLGGQQRWWLQPMLMSMGESAIYYGATALTAITDNAALTYLGSQVLGLSPEFKLALVAGAVTGGGLTVIANAPNPAGVAILRHYFADNTISPLGLLLGALPPTLVAIAAFRWL